jgi:hypothetical protein
MTLWKNESETVIDTYQNSFPLVQFCNVFDNPTTHAVIYDNHHGMNLQNCIFQENSHDIEMTWVSKKFNLMNCTFDGEHPPNRLVNILNGCASHTVRQSIEMAHFYTHFCPATPIRSAMPSKSLSLSCSSEFTSTHSLLPDSNAFDPSPDASRHTEVGGPGLNAEIGGFDWRIVLGAAVGVAALTAIVVGAVLLRRFRRRGEDDTEDSSGDDETPPEMPSEQPVFHELENLGSIDYENPLDMTQYMADTLEMIDDTDQGL